MNEALYYTILIVGTVYVVMMTLLFVIAFFGHTEDTYVYKVDAFECKSRYRKWYNMVRYVWRLIFIPFAYAIYYGEISKTKFFTVFSYVFYNNNDKGC